MNNLQNVANKLIVGIAAADGATIARNIQWLITGGGTLLAVWGIVQLVQSGRASDSQGKMEASWLVLGGILLIAIGGGTMIAGVFSTPPGN